MATLNRRIDVMATIEHHCILWLDRALGRWAILINDSDCRLSEARLREVFREYVLHCRAERPRSIQRR